MKQGLVLGRNRRRRRHHRQRLDALTGGRHQQPQTIIAHRLLPIGMGKDLAKRLDIGRKSRFTPLARDTFHAGPPTGQMSDLNTTFAVTDHMWNFVSQ